MKSLIVVMLGLIGAQALAVDTLDSSNLTPAELAEYNSYQDSMSKMIQNEATYEANFQKAVTAAQQAQKAANASADQAIAQAEKDISSIEHKLASPYTKNGQDYNQMDITIDENGNAVRTATKDNNKAKADRAAALAKIDAANQAKVEAQNALDAAQARLDAEPDKQNRIENGQQAKIMNLQARVAADMAQTKLLVKQMKADSDLSDVKYQNLRKAVALDEINKQFDNLALGVYVREKMTKVLQSPAFCKAQKACPNDNGKAIGPADLNDVFPSSPKNLYQSSPAATGDSTK